MSKGILNKGRPMHGSDFHLTSNYARYQSCLGLQIFHVFLLSKKLLTKALKSFNLRKIYQPQEDHNVNC